MYAIAGVTGHTGSVVADELLRRGRKVRVIVRSAEKGAGWEAKGAEVAVASLDDADALSRALSAVEGAYLLSPPDPASDNFVAAGSERGEIFASAIRASGVRHVVFLSSIGAQHDEGTGPIRSLHAIEQHLRPLSIALTILRPAYFLENWGAGLGPAGSNGVLPSFLPADFRFPQIATRDVSVAAAGALENAADGTRVFELAGPQDYTPSDIATTVGRILGRAVSVDVAPLDAVVPAFTSFGISRPMAMLYREMYEGILNGAIAWDGEGERKRGQTAPEDVFRPMVQR